MLGHCPWRKGSNSKGIWEGTLMTMTRLRHIKAAKTIRDDRFQMLLPC